MIKGFEISMRPVAQINIETGREVEIKTRVIQFGENFKKRLWFVLVALLPGLMLSGCLTSKRYKMASSYTPPAVTLDYHAEAPPLELTLLSVVVYKGPGSWKKEARWDEYLLRFRNMSEGPLAIVSAQLYDLQGTAQIPGEDPWVLEKLSRTNWDKYGKSGLRLVEGAGTVALYGAAVYSTGTAGLMGTAGAGAGVAVLDIIPLFALADITTVAIVNHSNKKKIEAAFDLRRLGLPINIAANSSVKGSLFFPMVPGPQRLRIEGKAPGGAFSVDLELGPLAGLHRKGL